MANNNITYGINFKVDNSSLSDLKKSLDDIVKTAEKVKFQGELDQELSKAAEEAKKLSTILSQSWNTKLNQLDLSKFNDSIQKSYGSIGNLKTALAQGGAVGASAFNKIAQSVLTTNVQIRQANQLLDKMAITMANTVRFGISSSVFNGLTNSISKAYNYAKDLDESLNNIRIVSGKSAENMASFAKQANKAAQELGSTTLNYTDASLIYYQQGLNTEEVIERTNTTIKMANALGASADEVSNYMTAIWNNFDDGSKSLEYYGDVITALGASTASSAEEIAEGLEKFAAIGDTVGLSYEYATSALATVVAETRQSADTVGTAFKTLFARIQGLKLGETLDDGTTLTKYSKALLSVGINIKDQAGELKDMDTILDEMGSKWGTLNKDQQVALAQTVAGTRQYSQLVALMDNWDTFGKNLQTTAQAAGTLEEQQATYMESVEAHLKQLQTEAEKTYATLFDSDAIKAFADAATKALSVLNSYLTGLGGGLNSIGTIALGATSLFSNQIGGMMAQRAANKQAQKENVKDQEVKDQFAQSLGAATGDQVYNQEALETQLDYYKRIKEVREQTNDIEAQEFNESLNVIGQLKEKIAFAKDYKNIAEQAGAKDTSKSGILDSIKQEKQAIAEETGVINNYKRVFEDYNKQLEENGGILNSENDVKKIVSALKETAEYQKMDSEAAKEANEVYEKIMNSTENIALSDEDVAKLLKGHNQELQEEQGKLYNLQGAYQGCLDEEKGIVVETEAQLSQEEAILQKKLAQKEAQKDYANTIKGVSTILSTITSASGVVSTLKNDDLSGWDKFQSILSVVAVQGVQLVKNWGAVKGAVTKGAGAAKAAIGALGAAGTAAVAAVAVAAVAIGVAIWAIHENAVKAQKQVEHLREASKKLKDEQNELDEKINNVKNDFDEYKSCVTTLESCTKGTKQWEDALNNVNNSVLNILEKYPDLAKIEGIVTRINGVLTFDQTKVDDYLDKQQRRSAALQASSLMANQVADKRQLEIDKKDIKSDVKDSVYLSNLKSNGGYGSGNPQNSKEIENTTNLFMDNIDKLSGLTESEYLAKLESLGIEAKYAEGLLKAKNSVDDFGEKTDEVATSISNTAKTVASLLLGNDLKKGTENTQTTMAAKDLDKYTEKEINSRLKKYTGSGISKASGNDNEIYKDMLKELQNVEGYENFKAASDGNGVLYTDNNRAFKFSVNGEEKEYSAEEIASIIGTAKAQEKVSNTDYEAKAQAIIDKIQKASGSEDEGFADKLIEAISSGDYSNLTEEEINQLKEAKKNGTFDNILTKEEAESIGLKGGNAVEKGIEKAIEQWDPKKAAETQKAKIEQMYKTAAEATGESEATIKVMVAGMKKMSKYAGVAEDKLIDLAKDSLLLDTKLEDLSDTLKDNKDLLNKWAKSIKNAADISADAVRAVGALKEKFDLIFDSDVDEEFLKKNFADIQAMLNGDADAADRLEQALGKDFILRLGVDEATFSAAEDAFNKLANTDLTVDAVFNDEKALQDIQKFFENAKLSKDKAQAVLNEYGYEGELQEIKQPGTTKTVFDYETSVVAGSYTCPAQKVNYFDQSSPNGISTATIPSYRMPTYSYQTKQVPRTVEEGGSSYWVLKPKGGASSANSVSYSNLKGSVKSTGAGLKRQNAVKSFSGGSSGGSGGSSSKKSVTKKQNSEENIYQKVNSELDKISNTLTKLQKQADRLTGKARIDNLIKQIQTVNNQINTTGKKLELAKKEANGYAKDLATTYGVSFGTDGIISNYSKIYNDELARYNAAINAYNASSQSDSDKDALDAAKDRYDEFKQLISDYDTLIGSTIPGLENDIDSQISEVISAKIEVFSAEVKIRLELDEASKEWDEFQKNVLENIDENDFAGQAKYTVKRYEDIMSNGILQKSSEKLMAAKDELEKMRTDDNYVSSWFGANGVNDQAAALKFINEQKETIMTYMTEANEKVKELQETLLASYNKTKEYFDDEKELYETAIKTYQHDMKLVQYMYGEEAYSKMGDYYDKISETYKYQWESQKENTAYWLEQMKSLEEGSDAWQQMRDNWIASLGEEQATLESYIESMQSKYINAIQTVFEKLNKSITNEKGLSYIGEEWGLISTNAESYLDSVNSAYKIQELQNKYTDAIEKSNNVEVQQKLNKLMNEQVTMLKEKDKLSQYDLDRANLQYEIALKQIALEEAQQNKSTMRLKRDSQGNYSYQYAADEDKISSLREELSDLYNQLYNLDADQYKQNLNDIYSVWEEYQQKMVEAAQINDPTERKNKEELLEKYYGERINNLIGDNENIRKGLYESTFLELKDLYGENSDAFRNAMLDQEATMEKIVVGWNSNIQKMIDTVKGKGGFAETYSEAIEEIKTITENFTGVQESLQSELDTSKKVGSKTQEELSKLLTTTQQFSADSKTATENVKGYIEQLGILIGKYEEIYTKAGLAATAANDLNTKIKNEELDNAGKVTEKQVTEEPPNEDPKPVTQPTTNTQPQVVSSQGNGSVDVGDLVTLNGKLSKSSTTEPSLTPSSKYKGAKLYVQKIVPGTKAPYHLGTEETFAKGAVGWVNLKQISGYDTGGYTGEWGSSGKLAVLHQKELILNATDTENVLKAIGILRNITTSISGLSSVPGTGSNGTLAQDVHIEATFPNVVSSNEIENALNNLVNVASQRIQER